MNRNVDIKLGSSETTREAPTTLRKVKNFTFNKNFLPEHKKNIDFSFLEWFIGFSEGTACFSSRIEDNRPRLSFEIVEKDAKLLYKIRTTLGFGIVRSFTRNNETYYKYTVENKQGLQRIMLLFNGNFVLMKRYVQFKNWVWVSKDIFSENFVVKNQCVQVSLKTAWLSGFIEAEGYFYANFTRNNLNSSFFNFNQKLTITQKDTHGESFVLQDILLLFENPGKIHMAEKPNCYRIQFDSLKSQTIIVHYFSQFPLLGNKKIAYRRWWRIYLRRQKPELKPTSLKTMEKYKRLCLMVNKKDF